MYYQLKARQEATQWEEKGHTMWGKDQRQSLLQLLGIPQDDQSTWLDHICRELSEISEAFSLL